MANYNDKYFFEFATLKTADEAELYYRVVFSKLESVATTHDLVELTPSNAPFILSYKASEPHVFAPLRTSSAEINILYPYNAAENVPEPIEFFTDSDYLTWQVRLYKITDSGLTSTLSWTGFLVESDLQQDWQDAYYYRLTATDNIGVLKDVSYTSTDEYKMPDYIPMEGVSIKDFIIELVNLSGNPLNYKFGCTYKYDATEYTLVDMFTSRYSAIDWESKKPLKCYDLLIELLTGIGCIMYQDNSDGKWCIVSVHEISTRTNNLVPYVEYDSEKAYVGTGNLEFDSSINTGEDDLVWRDKNQVVTLNKSYTSVEITHKYKPKNLLKNYSFQQSLNDAPPDEWEIQGTFPVNVTNEAYLYTGNVYDTNFLVNDNSEDNTGAVDISNYLHQDISYVDTPLENITFGDSAGFYVEFTSYIRDSSWNGTGGLEGFNFQIVNNLSGGQLRFDYSNSTNINNGGAWVGAGGGRIPVWSIKSAGLLRTKCLTAFTDLNDYTSLRFLKYRYTVGGVNQFYTVDHAYFCIIPAQIAGYGSALESFSYSATKGYRNFGTLSNNRRLNLKSNFGNLFDIIGLGDAAWYINEGSIGVKVGSPEYLTGEKFLWQNTYDTGELNNNYLGSLVCFNLLNHVNMPQRVITGNVYGDDISYLKLFDVQGALSKSTNVAISDAYYLNAVNQGATVEASNCGSNVLNEFNVVNAKFLMHEAKFDLRNSTTNVKIIEDVAERSFVGYGGYGDIKFSSSVLPSSTGSNSGNQDRPEGEAP